MKNKWRQKKKLTKSKLPKYYYSEYCGQYLHWDPKEKRNRWYGWRCTVLRRLLTSVLKKYPGGRNETIAVAIAQEKSGRMERRYKAQQVRRRK